MPKINYDKLFSYNPKTGLYSKSLTVTLPDGTKRQKRFTSKNAKTLYEKVNLFEKNGRSTLAYPTLQQLIDQWISSKESEWRPGTYASYDSTLKLLRPLYNIPINQLTPIAVQNRLYELHNQHYSGRVIRRLRGALDQAYTWIIPQYSGALQNPISVVKLPRNMKVTKRHAPTDEETQLIIESKNVYFGFFYFMLVYTGMRRGELLGLKWDNVDLDNEMIHITQQVTYVYGKPRVGPLKTESSYRDVPILSGLLQELMLRRPDEWHNLFVFGSPTDPTKPLPEKTLKRREMHYCKEIGFVTVEEIPRSSRTGAHYTYKKYHKTLTPHMLRHCTATICYEAGVDVMTTAALLGHADTRVTQEVYTDLRAKHKAQQLNKLKQFMAENYEQHPVIHSQTSLKSHTKSHTN